MENKKPFNPISGLPVQEVKNRKLYTINWEEMAKVKDFQSSFGFNKDGKKTGYNNKDNT